MRNLIVNQNAPAQSRAHSDTQIQTPWVQLTRRRHARMLKINHVCEVKYLVSLQSSTIGWYGTIEFENWIQEAAALHLMICCAWNFLNHVNLRSRTKHEEFDMKALAVPVQAVGLVHATRWSHGVWAQHVLHCFVSARACIRGREQGQVVAAPSNEPRKVIFKSILMLSAARYTSCTSSCTLCTCQTAEPRRLSCRSKISRLERPFSVDQAYQLYTQNPGILLASHVSVSTLRKSSWSSRIGC